MRLYSYTMLLRSFQVPCSALACAYPTTKSDWRTAFQPCGWMDWVGGGLHGIARNERIVNLIFVFFFSFFFWFFFWGGWERKEALDQFVGDVLEQWIYR